MSNVDTAILVVNGGRDPEKGRWISLFLKNLFRYTDRNKFNLLVWNNNISDNEIRKLQKKNNFYLFEPLPGDKMFHPHAVPLQRLFNIAIEKFQSQYIILMDSDAFPIKSGWFEILINAISSDTYQLAGVWRDELATGIKPYIHPSCMCFSSKFVLDNNLRLDYIGTNSLGSNYDTLSYFTDEALKKNCSLLKWKRSNKNNFHRLMGGIYGDYIYHHGAGSRKNIGFWDEKTSFKKSQFYDRVNRSSSDLLFTNQKSYISWLRGKNNLDFYKIIVEKHFPEPKQRNLRWKSSIKKKVIRLKSSLFNQNIIPQKKENLLFDNMRNIPTLEALKKLEQPTGWVKGLPDIVGLGVPKSGTSWWFEIILNHPHIVPHRFYDKTKETSKELHFFTHLGTKPITEIEKQVYRNCFLKQNKVLCSEFSTTYLHHPGSIDNLLQTISEEAVLVVILRNPIDRYISHINHVLRNRAKRFNLNQENEEVFKKYSAVPEAQNYSLYSDVIASLLAKVGAQRLFFDVYENIAADPQKAYQRFIDFIGLDYYPILNSDFTKPKNKQEYIISKPTSSERKLLSSYFAEDVRRLKRLFPEMDLSRWNDFK